MSCIDCTLECTEENCPFAFLTKKPQVSKRKSPRNRIKLENLKIYDVILLSNKRIHYRTSIGLVYCGVSPEGFVTIFKILTNKQKHKKDLKPSFDIEKFETDDFDVEDVEGEKEWQKVLDSFNLGQSIFNRKSAEAWEQELFNMFM